MFLCFDDEDINLDVVNDDSIQDDDDDFIITSTHCVTIKTTEIHEILKAKVREDHGRQKCRV